VNIHDARIHHIIYLHVKIYDHKIFGGPALRDFIPLSPRLGDGACFPLFLRDEGQFPYCAGSNQATFLALPTAIEPVFEP
jgi:hypothetical protein